MNKTIFAALSLLLVAAPVFAGVATPGRAYKTDDHIVSVSFFTWFSPTRGQSGGPWRPIEGRENWGGKEHWKNQIRQTMRANIDTLWIHLITGRNPADEQRRIFNEAYAELRAEGYKLPTIAPFLDPLIIWGQYEPDEPNKPIDMATEEGIDKFVRPYIIFFRDYFAANKDKYADSYIQTIDGKVLLDTWHIWLTLNNYDKCAKEQIEKRLIAEFGEEHPIFKNGVYIVGTGYSETFPFADEGIIQFEQHAYNYETQLKNVRCVQLKGGYWDQNVRNPGYMMPRDGGVHYIDAWEKVDRDKIKRVYIESWNEYDEGSGIYAAKIAEPYLPKDRTAATRSDVWSNSGNPFEYIDTTAKYAAKYNDAPDSDGEILAADIRRELKAGETVTAKFTLRNTGNEPWTEGKVSLACDDEGFNVVKSALTDKFGDIARLGAVYRNMPAVVEAEFVAPAKPGTYMTHWNIVDKDGKFVGRAKSILLSVK